MNEKSLRPISGEIYGALGRERKSIASLAQTIGLSETTLRRRLAHPNHLTVGEILAICTALEIRPGAIVQLLDNVA